MGLVSWDHSWDTNRCFGSGTHMLKDIQEQRMLGLSIFPASSVSRVTEALMGSQDPRVTRVRKERG